MPATLPHIMIVTGAHLSAEVYDRPLAYRLQSTILRALKDDEVTEPHRKAIVCSDVWYLNQNNLRALPTISIGGPSVNALTAYLASRLPSVLAIDNTMIIQLDDRDCPVATCWGIDASTTAAAIEAFEEKFLDHFLSGVHVP
jgi:hypothetical protein